MCRPPSMKQSENKTVKINLICCGFIVVKMLIMSNFECLIQSSIKHLINFTEKLKLSQQSSVDCSFITLFLVN